MDGNVTPALADSPGLGSQRSWMPHPSPRVADRLGGGPSGCACPSPKPRPVSDLYAPLVGTDVTWAGFYARLEAPDSFHVTDVPRTEFGYRIKALWVMTSAQADPVSVTGGSDSGDVLLFDTGERPSPEAVLDPDAPGTVPEDPDWKEYPSYLYFPRAGCYLLEVAWPGGGWAIGFGLGK